MKRIENPHNLKSLAASLEMIDFQSDDFGMKLDEQFATFIAKCNDGEYRTDDQLNAASELRVVEKLTFDRTGIKVNLHRLYKTFFERILPGSTFKDASTIPLNVNVNHVFLDLYNSDMLRDLLRRDQASFIKKLKDRVGLVDERRAKVGGFYSEYENDIFLDIQALAAYGLSSSEVTAVFLHELGHVFTTMSHANRLDKTNQVLSELAKVEAGGKKMEAAYIFRELEMDGLGVDKQKFIAECGEVDHIPGAMLFKATGIVASSQMRDSTYSRTASEQMSDSFAARFGYGRQIVTGLDKLHRSGIDAGLLSTGVTGHVFKNIREIAVMFLFPLDAGLKAWMKGPGSHDKWYSYLPSILLSIGAATGSVPLLGVLYAASIAAYFRSTGTDMRDWTYDDLLNRYKRIRNEQVVHLKDLDLRPEQISAIVADIKQIDESLKSAYDDNKTVLAFLANLVFTSARKAEVDITHQRLLEELSANELFVKAAVLRS